MPHRKIDSPSIIRSLTSHNFIRINKSFEEKTQFKTDELLQKPFKDWIVTEDQNLLSELINGNKDVCQIRHKTKNGNTILLNTRLSKTNENDPVILARLADHNSQPKYKKQFSNEGNVKSTLHEIAHIIEEQNPGYKCSILLVEDGRFVKGAGPSLPDEYNNAIDGFAIGPTVGSCGTAIYWNVPVVVCDIQNDPLWEPFAELAKTAGVNSCWSHPFTSKSGRVLGALALYSPETRTPSDEELRVLKAAAGMTGLAVERGRAEEALREKHQQALELEDQLRQAAKMEALGVLAGGVAHDFNNVLATILANAEFTLLTLTKDSTEQIEKVKSRLTNIISACNRAGHFCNQMLSYAGRGQVERKRTEIGELVSELDSLVLAALSKKTVLEFELSKDPIFVNGDENQLLQVIMNLITNAAEAIEDKEGKILVSSKVETLDKKTLTKLAPEEDLSPGQYLSLSVQDNGSGMDDETQARIFDPFYTTKSTGRGLGLSAVKGIIKMHHGTLLLSSKLNIGTTFTILLPTDQAITKSETEEVSKSLDHSTSLNRKVLLADDEPDLLSVLSESLTHYGYEVIPAKDGQEAVELFAGNLDSFDCVLMDLSMPRLNGQEAALKIHQLNSETPIILMSGYNESEIHHDVNKNILTKSLQKPINLQSLLETLNETLNKDESLKKSA